MADPPGEPPLYMLDTNAASAVFRDDYVAFRKRLAAVPISQICISAITRAELKFGVAKVRNNPGLRLGLHEFLLRVDTLRWDTEVADQYGELRAELERVGKPLGNLDMLIAAHALAVGAVLVTNDRTFRQVPKLKTEDWTK